MNPKLFEEYGFKKITIRVDGRKLSVLAATINGMQCLIDKAAWGDEQYIKREIENTKILAKAAARN